MVDLRLVKPQDLWYAVGLITTDGNLSTDGRHINITSKDEDLLLSVKNGLFLKNKIGRKARGHEQEKKYFVLAFGDVNFYKFLQATGLSVKKSLTLGSLDIPDKYFRDFLRGVIDGDGSIEKWRHKSNGYEQWSLRIASAAPLFVEWLKDRIENFFLVKGRIHGYFRQGKKNKIYTIKFGKLPAKIILAKCYYPSCISLERKNCLARECLKTENGLSKYGNIVPT